MPVQRFPVVTALLLATWILSWGPARAADVDFARDIKPVLEQACLQCHGPEKQKGELRLDTAEALQKGGDSGPAVVSGAPGKSELFRRIALAESEEEVMPPKGKVKHLSAAQIDAIKQWIAAGAPWPAGLVAVAPNKKAELPIGPVPSPDELAARAELAKRGLRVRPVAGKVNWTRLSLRSAPRDLATDTWPLLARLLTLQELDLGGSGVTDEQLTALSPLSNLATLNLSETAITDAALDRLSALARLTSLNLFATKVTDAGLAKLADRPQLKQLFLAATKVTPAGVAGLQKSRPGLRIDVGGEFADLTKLEFFGPEAPKGFVKPTTHSPRPGE